MTTSGATDGAAEILHGMNNYLLDLDGCLWFGDELAPGAVDLVQELRATGKRVGFLTNASVATASGLALKLERLGIQAREGDVVAPLNVLADHDAFRTSRRALVLGTAAVREQLEAHGIETVMDADEAEVVVVGKDRDLTYLQLAEATHALLQGARLLALNLDASVPVAGGRRSPGVGAIAAALTTASGVAAELLGKPSGTYFRHALRQFEMAPEDTVMVGDTPETDIRGGRAVGLLTVLVADPGRQAAPSASDAGEDPEDRADLHVHDLPALREYLAPS